MSQSGLYRSSASVTDEIGDENNALDKLVLEHTCMTSSAHLSMTLQEVALSLK
jgi:hypothetical protein